MLACAFSDCPTRAGVELLIGYVTPWSFCRQVLVNCQDLKFEAEVLSRVR